MCDVGVLNWERSSNEEFLSTMTESCPNISALEFKPLKRNGHIYERPYYCNIRIGPQNILQNSQSSLFHLSPTKLSKNGGTIVAGLDYGA